MYQKVFNDKQKLINQLDEINTQLQNSGINEKISLITTLQNDIKKMEREKTTLENIIIKQEKSIMNLQNKINKYDKQLNKKNEELLVKEDIINELNEKIRELIEKNKNMKNNFKIAENNEIMKMNDKINNLKNELEIKDKKIELINIKLNNLQIKYLKLFQKNRKIENESLLRLSKEKVDNIKVKNFFYTPKKNYTINYNIINDNGKKKEISENLPIISDVNGSVSINNNKRLVQKKQNLEVKDSYSTTSNNNE